MRTLKKKDMQSNMYKGNLRDPENLKIVDNYNDITG
jgi:hypothetical protein